MKTMTLWTAKEEGGVKPAVVGASDDKSPQPTTSPVPGFTVGGKLISPNDSHSESREDFQEFQEQRNPNSFLRASVGMPLEAEYAAYRVAEIAPRLSSQYDTYMKNYAAGTAYKSMSYSSVRDEYSAARRYEAMNFGPSSARGQTGAGGTVAGQVMIQRTPYGGLEQVRRNVLKTASGPGGYWGNSNEWATEFY